MVVDTLAALAIAVLIGIMTVLGYWALEPILAVLYWLPAWTRKLIVATPALVALLAVHRLLLGLTIAPPLALWRVGLAAMPIVMVGTWGWSGGSSTADLPGEVAMTVLPLGIATLLHVARMQAAPNDADGRVIVTEDDLGRRHVALAVSVVALLWTFTSWWSVSATLKAIAYNGYPAFAELLTWLILGLIALPLAAHAWLFTVEERADELARDEIGMQGWGACGLAAVPVVATFGIVNGFAHAHRIGPSLLQHAALAASIWPAMRAAQAFTATQTAIQKLWGKRERDGILLLGAMGLATLLLWAATLWAVLWALAGFFPGDLALLLAGGACVLFAVTWALVVGFLGNAEMRDGFARTAVFGALAALPPALLPLPTRFLPWGHRMALLVVIAAVAIVAACWLLIRFGEASGRPTPDPTSRGGRQDWGRPGEPLG